MGIVWSREAGERLLEIEAFIAHDSPERAVRFVDALIDHAESMLAANPRCGRMVPELARSEIRELIYRGYRIVYGLREKDIVILTVFEGHRLLRMDETT